MATLAVVLVGATPSQAGLVLDFDLSGSALSLGTLVNVSDGMGATVAGKARVELTGVNAQGMLTGPTAQGTISGLDLTFDLDTPIVQGLDANFVGPIRISQMGMTTGAFDGTTLLASGLNGSLSTSVGCVGSACPNLIAAGLFMFPIVQNVTFTNPFAIHLQDLGSGMATLDASLMGMNNSLSFRLAVRGRQAPEPLEAGLLALGVLALCGIGAVRRLRLP